MIHRHGHGQKISRDPRPEELRDVSVGTTLGSKAPIQYKYNEVEILDNLRRYIDSTYSSHYSENKIQATEFIIDSQHGEGFCVGNIIKYAQRFGRKRGKNKKDIFKLMHYAIILLSCDPRETGPKGPSDSST